MTVKDLFEHISDFMDVDIIVYDIVHDQEHIFSWGAGSDYRENCMDVFGERELTRKGPPFGGEGAGEFRKRMGH